MRFGITTPIVTLNPKGHADWETAAGPEQLTAIARCADRLGYHHLSCSEHIAVPQSVAETRGATYWDPLSTLSWMAAQTTRIRLATHVLVLGYHHPLEIVKRYGTLDVLSGGRVILGVGVGSLEAEFELLGADFEHRGSLADESLRKIRRAWGRHLVDDLVISPHSPRSEVDVWVGGRSGRSLRRAVEFGTGWVPFAMTDDQLRSALADHDRPDGFEVILWAYGIDPSAAPDVTSERIHELTDVGATIINVRFVSRSVEHWCEQAEALMTISAGGT